MLPNRSVSCSFVLSQHSFYGTSIDRKQRLKLPFRHLILRFLSQYSDCPTYFRDNIFILLLRNFQSHEYFVYKEWIVKHSMHKILRLMAGFWFCQVLHSNRVNKTS